ncbi:DUF1624 domain-containing protein [Gluconacetobacter azotocaptans]|uniref:DUF1624 domain-containing protein n=1 Tax=Gluconacetobacter azotocaptans TaxID=142834 RepID=A0A7W4JUQ6_9PROT|nr:heparan-alpha-glucosaminide N-acetyltransferase domain-containing protein [Gluconacetobacter azotocaptans]MBB2191254.1 DUF1624 domain-containing protein [Gluconacetobacter azotocaptans]MBM9402038.1 DUF1624 domain-containing protein [Gluconacetobacter azotocaptans]GBQ25767.1 hypothetical protein AA13594_0017 [Gluconacetobacter azotocaptans DSM 13594]
MNRPERIEGIDAARGAIMLIMATDHVNALVVRRHSVEFWAGAWTRYGTGAADLLQLGFRVLSDLCAPGFFFWMGAGVALLASRRADWPGRRLAGHVALRGLILVLLSWVIEVPAWVVGIHGDRTGAHPGGWPGAGPAIGLPVTVLTTLGICTMVLALMQPLMRRRAAMVLPAMLALAGLCVLSPSLFLPGDAGRPVGMPARLGLVAGQTGGLYVEYPVLPWLGVALLGHVFARFLIGWRAATLRAVAWIGIVCLLAAILLRWHGTFGNLRPPRDGSWREFFNLVKYPPAPVFVLAMLGGNLCLFRALSRPGRVGRFCAGFGRAPLPFYLAHLWLFAVIGAVFFPMGTQYGVGVLVWLAGLWPLRRLCLGFARMRRNRPASSWVHLF